jgi:hypothetical protein
LKGLFVGCSRARSIHRVASYRTISFTFKITTEYIAYLINVINVHPNSLICDTFVPVPITQTVKVPK